MLVACTPSAATDDGDGTGTGSETGPEPSTGAPTTSSGPSDTEGDGTGTGPDSTGESTAPEPFEHELLTLLTDDGRLALHSNLPPTVDGCLALPAADHRGRPSSVGTRSSASVSCRGGWAMKPSVA